MAAWVAETLMKPLPPAWATARERAVISGSSGRGNGIRSITTSRQDVPGHVDALPQRHGAEEAGVRFVGELLHERRHGRLPLAEDAQAQPGPHGLGGLLGGAPRGEQAQGAAAGGPDQLLELVEGLRGRPAAGFGQVLGNVEDALLRIFERGADVDAGPARGAGANQAEAAGGRFEGRPDRQGRRGQDDGVVREQALAQPPGDAERGNVDQRRRGLVRLRVALLRVEAAVAGEPDHLAVFAWRPGGVRRAPGSP